jgi:probable F420-dependent oxidoreductase
MMKTFLHLNTSTGGSTGIEHAHGNEFFSAPALAAVSQAAERAGFYGVYVTEHPFPSDARLKAGVGHHSLDPLVALSVAAAVTSRIRLCTYIYVLPYHNPFVAARAMASLDVVSGGRLVMGVGVGWMEEEFEALGVNFAERNELTDEAIRAMKAAWTQENVKMEGRHFRARGNTLLPQPVQKPHPPIYVGGNSRIAARRAGELGDGFMPFLNPARFAGIRHTAAIETLDQFAKIVNYSQSVAKAAGRPPLDIGGMLTSLGPWGQPGFDVKKVVAEAHQLKEMGVNVIYLGVGGATYKEQAEQLDRMGQEVLPHLP